MKKITLFFALFLSLLVLKAESYEETFAQFAEVTRIDDIFGAMTNEQFLAQNLESQITQFGIEIDKKTKADLVGAIKEVLQIAKPEFDKYMFEVYKKHYTQDELNELIAFYSTPIGKKSAKLQGKLTQEGAIAGEQIMQKYQPLLAEKLQKILESNN